MNRPLLRKAPWTLAIVVLLAGNSAARAQVMEKINTVRESDTLVLDAKGDGVFTGKVTFPNEAIYDQIKQTFPSPYTLLRQVLGSNGRVVLEKTNVSYDDATRSVLMSANILGSAMNRRGHWRVQVGKNAELLYTDNHKCILINIAQMGNDAVLMVSGDLQLPEGCKNVKMDREGGYLLFDCDQAAQAGPSALEVDLKSKPRIMSALYKIYSNEDLGQGIYWAAKTLFTNSGTGDISDLKVSYRLGEYAPWSADVEYGTVKAGGHVVDLYYPLIKQEAAELKSPTPVDLEVKYSYLDSDGKSHQDTTSKRVTLLGGHQFEWSNFLDEERTPAWGDAFSNGPLVAGLVTKMDEPVRVFGGIVAQACGGQPAAYTEDAAVKFCRALYDQEKANGIVYQSPASYLLEYTAGQELKYPRDVLRDKSGTCIELALLYAAVCENAGLKSYIMLIPGHAFPVVRLPSGELMPVESTGLSGPAVGAKQSLTFDQAVHEAQQETAQLKYGQFILVDVEEMQREGVSCPELPSMPADVLTVWGYKLMTDPTPAPRGGGTQPPSPIIVNNNPPAPLVRPAAMVGTWTGRVQMDKADVDVSLLLAAAGKYTLSLTDATGQAQNLAGEWSVEQQNLVFKHDDGTTTAIVFDLSGDSLTVKSPVLGEIHLSRKQ